MIFNAPIQYLIWIAGLLGLAATAVLLKRSGRTAQYPFFFGYLLFDAAHAIVLLWVRHDPVAYFYCYYIGTLIIVALSFAVLYESSKAALSLPTFTLSKTHYFQLCALLCVVAVAVVAALDFQQQSLILRARVMIETALRIDQVGVLLIFMFATRFFGLYWKRLEFGIVAGYGAYAVVELLALYMRASQGEAVANHFAIFKSVSFLFAICIWLFYARSKDPVTPRVEVPVLAFREALQFVDRTR